MQRSSEIQVPQIQNFLEYQLSEFEIQRLCIHIGRLFYKLGEKDKWNKFPVIEGIGHGKSTLLRLISAMFEPERVGILVAKPLDVDENGTISETSEYAYNLSFLADKDVFLCSDMQSLSRGTVSTLHSMATGEDQWSVPGILSGNCALVGFSDKPRAEVFYFSKPVEYSKMDSQLLNKLMTELSQFKLKCNLAYLEAVEDEHTK